jgi:excisionase family DNA binding protein
MSGQKNGKPSLPVIKLFSVAEVALIIGVSKKLVRQWIEEGRIPAFRVGANSRLLRVRQEDLEKFIDENTQYYPPKFTPEAD